MITNHSLFWNRH